MITEIVAYLAPFGGVMTSPSGLRPWKVSVLLAGIGAVGGTIAGLALTIAGNVLSGAPSLPAPSVYLWNIAVFATVGAIGAPIMTWSALRRVPLWRAVGEPAVAGIVGSVAAMAIAPALFPVLVPAAITAAAFRLSRQFRDRSQVEPGS